MYLEHYHLKRKPFGLTPGPDFFWLSEKHKEALATLRYGVMGDLGFLLLTGEVGVGKTALIHRLLTSLDSSTLVAHITDPGVGINDFFRLLAVEFGIDTPFKSKGEFLIILERFLRQADKDQKKVLLIVDEAQRVNNVLLDQIRVLSNIELNDRKLINIFFVGQPEFKNMLLASVNRPIRQRIAIYYHVPPFTESETGQYIEHRLKIAGAKTIIFKPDAIREIYRISQGYPRGINIHCDLALLTGYASGAQTIDSKIIKECGNELNIEADMTFPPPRPESTPLPEIRRPKSKPESKPESAPAPSPPPPQRLKAWAYPAVITIGIAVVGLAGYYFLSPGPGESPPPPIEKAAAPPAYPLPGAQTDEKTAPPTSPPSDTELAMAAPARGTPGPLNPGQDILEPQPEAPETTPELTTPTPPPETEISVARAEKTQALPAPTVDDESPAQAPAPIDDTDTGSLLAVTTEQATPGEAPSLEADQTVSPGGLSEPTTATEPTTAGIDQEAPTEQPTGQQRATLAPSKASTQEALVDQPPAAPEQKTDQSIPPQPVENQTSNAASDMPADNATAPPPPAPGAAPAAEPTVNGPTMGVLAPVPGPTTPADLPTPPAGPAIPATAALQPQSTASELAVTDKVVIDQAMEDRVRSFLQDYCSTYASKDLDSFRRYFASDAMENGKAFQSQLPKYQKNFTFIDTIYYRIELQQVTHGDEGKMLTIDGDFFLRWLPPDKKWRENAGKISMTLEENGSSFLVHRLDYRSNRSNTN